MIKKAMFTILILLICLGYSFAESINVTINDQFINFDVEPQIVNDRTLVPMRAIFEALGLLVEWDQETKTATGKNQDITMELTIDSPFATINGKKIHLETPARIIENRTMVPIRFISESLGAKVDWIAETKTIEITSKTIMEKTPNEQISEKIDNFMFQRSRLYESKDTVVKELDELNKEMIDSLNKFKNFESQYLQFEEYTRNKFERYDFENGDYCYGEFTNDGKLTGLVAYYSKDYKYVGTFLDGKFSGRGYYKYSNGDVYLGDFQLGVFSGLGYFRSSDDGFESYGYYENNYKVGTGIRLALDTNYIEVGNYKDNKLYGNYKITYDNGKKEYAKNYYNNRGFYYTEYSSSNFKITDIYDEKNMISLMTIDKKDVEYIRYSKNNETYGEGMTYYVDDDFVYLGEYLNSYVENPTSATYYALDKEVRFKFQENIESIIDKK